MQPAPMQAILGLIKKVQDKSEPVTLVRWALVCDRLPDYGNQLLQAAVGHASSELCMGHSHAGKVT